MKKRLLLCASLIFLVGCASKRQIMPEANYKRFAATEVAVDTCLKANYISYQEAGQAHSNVSIFLSSWAYDPVRYSNLLAQASQMASKLTVTQSNCNIIRAKIYQDTLEAQRYQHQLEIASQQRAIADQQALQSIQNMQNNLPKTTYCNQYGTQTICNSY